MTTSDEVMAFFQTPSIFWEKADFKGKTQIHHLIFKDRIEYYPNEGFQTAKISILFRLCERFSTPKSSLVETRNFVSKNFEKIMFEVKCIFEFLNAIQ